MSQRGVGYREWGRLSVLHSLTLPFLRCLRYPVVLTSEGATATRTFFTSYEDRKQSQNVLDRKRTPDESNSSSVGRGGVGDKTTNLPRDL